ncbi:ABC transporter permease [Mucilaginibacter sp. SP1R1]|uniref:ABC transporter permease n=1 Tax=Mucilaginibacter sp. SP1R1 TaxID=2723091 RepID=UPI001611DA4F|nr:ABC transporter permease [Mucilaginibacter sp. SP1R1]MBB6148689.1 putative ABC transport system permease protein [Mucilaginibacter sp. SP1R1]
MFKHLFKLIWNKKKQNFLLLTEMLFSFLVLFAVFSMLVYYYTNYKKPMGFDYNNAWLVTYNNTNKTQNTDSLNLYYQILQKMMKAMPEVKEVSFCSDNVPLSNYTNGGSVMNGKLTVGTNKYTVDDNYDKAFNTQLLEGRWLNKSDAVGKYPAVVINSNLKEELFGDATAVGKIITDDYKKSKMRVIGVIQGLKVKGDYAPSGNAVYFRVDTGSFHWIGSIIVKVKPMANAAFEARLYKTMANYMKDSNISIEHFTNKRTQINYMSLVPMMVMSIVGCFLIINVALGLFGVLWYNINKRRGEIGLRRAVGATGHSVSVQLIMESMILATMSLIIGTFFAVQFPLLNVFNLSASIYVMAILLSIVFIYLLVFLCSLYPGRQAAAIYPAVALHEE